MIGFFAFLHIRLSPELISGDNKTSEWWNCDYCFSYVAMFYFTQLDHWQVSQAACVVQCVAYFLNEKVAPTPCFHLVIHWFLIHDFQFRFGGCVCLVVSLCGLYLTSQFHKVKTIFLWPNLNTYSSSAKNEACIMRLATHINVNKRSSNPFRLVTYHSKIRNALL